MPLLWWFQLTRTFEGTFNKGTNTKHESLHLLVMHNDRLCRWFNYNCLESGLIETPSCQIKFEHQGLQCWLTPNLSECCAEMAQYSAATQRAAIHMRSQSVNLQIMDRWWTGVCSSCQTRPLWSLSSSLLWSNLRQSVQSCLEPDLLMSWDIWGERETCRLTDRQAGTHNIWPMLRTVCHGHRFSCSPSPSMEHSQHSYLLSSYYSLLYNSLLKHVFTVVARTTKYQSMYSTSQKFRHTYSFQGFSLFLQFSTWENNSGDITSMK
jgi:hypothetical protein